MAESPQQKKEQIISDLRTSLAWTDLVLSNINEGILVIGDDMRILFANDAIAEMMDKPRIILLGKPLWEILALSIDGKQLQKIDYKNALKQDHFKSFAGRYQFRSGKSNFTVDISTSFITRMNQAIFFIRDVTQQVENEQALMKERIARTQEQVEQQKTEENRRLLQNIIDGTTAIIYLKDSDGRYVTVNNRFKEVFGLGSTEIKGKTDSDVFTEEIAKVLQKNDEQVLKTKEVLRWEVKISHKNKQYTYISLKYPLFDLENKPYRICGVLTDITERKRLEESKDDFIKMAAHELQTPITSVKILLNFTKRYIEEGEIEKSLRDFSKFENQLDKLSDLVEELLDVSRMETGKLELKREEFNLSALVKETIEIVKRTTEQHVIHLLNGSEQHHIFADRQRIYHVLINLLTNAIKYSPEGGDIIIRIQSNTDQVTVSVQDFGIGISQEHQENIFEQFYRGSTRAKEFKGIGIGLYIASEIIKLHKGTMHVESEEGKGSTFSFQFPK